MNRGYSLIHLHVGFPCRTSKTCWICGFNGSFWRNPSESTSWRLEARRDLSGHKGHGLVGEILLLSKKNSLETKGSKQKHNFDMCLTSMPIMQPWFVPSRKIYAIDILCVRQETFLYSPCLLLESFLDSWQPQTTQYLARRLNHCSKLNEKIDN